jgi:hypothetical protein
MDESLCFLREKVADTIRRNEETNICRFTARNMASLSLAGECERWFS